jgi:hypothetical protein
MTGKTWTLQTLPSNVIKKNYIDFLTDKPMTLEWDGTAFILSLNKQIAKNYNFLYSYDAVTWQTQQSHLITSANIIKYMASTTVIAGEDTTNSLILKRNGNYNNFRVPRTANTKQMYDIELNQEYSNQIIFSRNYSYAISTDHQSLYQSTDYGATWLKDSSSNLLSILSTSIRYIDYNNQAHMWVAVGQGSIDTIAVRRETEVANADRYEWIGRGNHCLLGEGKKVKWSTGLKHWLAISDTNICLSKDGYYWLPVHSYPTVKDFDTSGKQCTIALGEDGICYGTSPTSFTLLAINQINGITGGMNSVEQILWSGTQWVFLLKNTSTNLTNIYVSSTTSMRDFTLVANDEITISRLLRVNSNLFLISPTTVYKSYHGYSPTPYTIIDVSGVTNINYNGSYYTLYISNNQSKNTWDFVNYTTDISYNIEQITNNDPTIPRIEIDPILLAGGESVSPTTIQYSYDGYRWLSTGSNVLSTRTNTFAWNGNVWIAGGKNIITGASIAYSYDGILWKEIENTVLSECYDIQWNGERFMATGMSGSGVPIISSTDGIHWQHPIGNGLSMVEGYSIQWNGTNWILYGNSSYIYSSLDTAGENWQPVAYSLNDLSGCVISEIVASTDNTDAFSKLTDGSYNTYWETTNNGYDTSGNYIGSSNFQGISGENLIATLTVATAVKIYEFVFLSTDNAIPQQYTVFGSLDNITWTQIDTYEATTAIISPQIDNKYIRIHQIMNQSTEYLYYGVVFQKTATTTQNIRLREWKLYGVSDSSRIVSAREKLIMNHRGFSRNYRTDSTTSNVAHYDRTMTLYPDHYVSNQLMNRINTINNKTITSNTQTETNMYLLTDISGGVYISYDSSAGLFSRQTTGQTGIYSSCYYGGHFYVGGTSGIQYSHPSDTSTWYNVPEQGLTTVFAMKTNQKMGYTVSSNAIYLREKDMITMTTPKSYTDSMQHSSGMNTSIEYVYIE